MESNESDRSAGGFVGALILFGAAVAVIAMLIPSFYRAREPNMITSCKSNLREIGNAVMMYQESFGDNVLYPWDGIHTGDEWFAFFTAASEGGVSTLAGGGTVTLPYPDILVCPGTQDPTPTRAAPASSFLGRVRAIEADRAGVPLAADKEDNHHGRHNVLRLPTQVRTHTGNGGDYEGLGLD